MPKRNEKFARLKVHVTVEGQQVAVVDGCVDLKGMSTKVLQGMSPEAVSGLVRASVLKLTPSLQIAQAEMVREKLLRIVGRVEREEAKAKEERARKEADEEMIVVEEDEDGEG